METTLETLRSEAEAARNIMDNALAEAQGVDAQSAQAAERHQCGDYTRQEAAALKIYEQAQDDFAAGKLDAVALAAAREAHEAAGRLAEEAPATQAAFDQRKDEKQLTYRDAKKAFEAADKAYWIAVYKSISQRLQKQRELVLQAMQVASRIPYMNQPDLKELFNIPRESIYLSQAIDEQREVVDAEHGLCERTDAAA